MSCFCAENQLSGKIPENIPKVLFSQKTHGARRRGAEGPEWAKQDPGAGLGLATPGWRLAASGTFPASPFAYMTYVTRNLEGVRSFSQNKSAAPPPPETLF